MNVNSSEILQEFCIENAALTLIVDSRYDFLLKSLELPMIIKLHCRFEEFSIFINCIVSIKLFFKVYLRSWFIVRNVFWEIVVWFKSFFVCIYGTQTWSKQLQIEIYKTSGFSHLSW